MSFSRLRLITHLCIVSARCIKLNPWPHLKIFLLLVQATLHRSNILVRCIDPKTLLLCRLSATVKMMFFES